MKYTKKQFNDVLRYLREIRFALTDYGFKDEEIMGELETAIKHTAIMTVIPAKNYEEDICKQVLEEAVKAGLRVKEAIA